MIPAAYRHYLDLRLANSYLPIQPIEGEVTTLSGVVLCRAPEELNNIELTVVFGQKQAKVAGCFNNLHNLAFLLKEIWLIGPHNHQRKRSRGGQISGQRTTRDPKYPSRAWSVERRPPGQMSEGERDNWEPL